MKKFLAPLAALALFGAVYADSAITNANVEAESIDLIEAPASVSLALTAPTSAEATQYVTAVTGTANVVKVSHNKGTNMKVTVAAGAEATTQVQDITLSVATASDSLSWVEIVTGGSPSNTGTDQDFVTGVAAGTSTYGLYWDLSATVAGTQPGDYSFPVTFTTTDEGGL